MKPHRFFPLANVRWRILEESPDLTSITISREAMQQAYLGALPGVNEFRQIELPPAQKAPPPHSSTVAAEHERKAEMRRQRQSLVQPSQLNRSKPNPKRKPRDHYTTDSYRRAIQRACDSADAAAKATSGVEEEETARFIPRWHPHQLRHNFATAIRKNHGIEAARVLLGHKTMAVAEVYAEMDREKVVDIVANVG